MRLLIQNIGKIQKANINLNGLTVITGVNDSGKSTVGKILFTTIKGLAQVNRDTQSIQEEMLKKHVDSLYAHLPVFGRILFPKNKSLISARRNLIEQLLSKNLSTTEFKKKIIAYIEKENISLRRTALVERDINNIIICIENIDNPAAVQAAEIQSFIETEFINSVCSSGTDKSKIKFMLDDFSEETPDDIEYNIKDNQVQHVKIAHNIKINLSINDVTYIESPLYLHLLDTLLYASSFRDVEIGLIRHQMVPSHIADFVQKINLASISNKKDSKTLNVNIENIIDGSFIFDKDSRSIKLKRDNTLYSPINVASGIKSFGVIQLLLQGGYIDPNKILIWDEPENHVHPEWQIKLAEIFIVLVKSGVPLLICTHSPYFLQALRYYSEKYDVTSAANYYLAQENKMSGLSEIQDVTNNLNKVFSILTDPLTKIVNFGKE